EVRVHAPLPVLLDGDPLPSGATLHRTGEALPLCAGEGLDELIALPARGSLPAVAVYGEAGDLERAEVLVRLAHSAAELLHATLGVEGGRLRFVSAPLRDRFVQVAGDRTILYSDRLFHVLFLLRRFHEGEAVRAAILALVRQALRDLPLGADRDWICEGVAWLLSREWVRARKGLEARQLRTGLEWLSFIPSIDRVLRAPRFAGSDLFYGHFYEPAVAVPDGFSRALSRRARGRVPMEKLRDRLGEERLWQLVRGLFGPGSRAERAAFRERAARLAGEPLDLFFELWLGPTPPQNLRVRNVEVLDRAEGARRVRVHLRRDTDDGRIGAVGDPVDVEGTGPGGAPVRARWDGRGDDGVVEMRLEDALWSPIRVDPERRIFQTIYADDQVPHLPFRVLLNRFRARVDLNRGNRNEVAVGLTLHPRFDYAHAVTLDAFYEQDEHGIAASYRYGFGHVLDERRYGASVGFGLNAASLGEGVLIDLPETEGELFSLNAGVGFDTRRSRLNPTWGLALRGGLEWADRWFDTRFRFTRLRASLSLVFSIVRGTTLGAELEVGQLEGNDDEIPSQRLFDAGGESTIRGVRTSRFTGRALFAVRGELRHMVVEDLDVPLLWLAWLRKVQVVAFLDAGDVGRRVEDILRSDPLWKWGAGGGVRFFVDVFGVTNVTLRFDVAVRIDQEAEDREPQFYLGANQSF
ncbi:MAG: hypothetical protein D6731_10960, partial [Planctomycetota bacterium]